MELGSPIRKQGTITYKISRGSQIFESREIIIRRGLKLGDKEIETAIANVLKTLDISDVDDTTYKRLVNIGLQYDYIESELFEQMIETELIIFLEECRSDSL
jgi:hypothetical protein